MESKKIHINGRYDFERKCMVLKVEELHRLEQVGFKVKLRPQTWADTLRSERACDLFTPGGKAVKPKASDYRGHNPH